MSKPITIHHKDTLSPFRDTTLPDPNEDKYFMSTIGFWVYLMTDSVLFATLFCTYGVLHGETFDGPTSKDLFDLSAAFIETMVLLVSSVTCGFAMISAVKSKRNHVIGWLLVSFLLGATFVGLELNEFAHLVREGNSWTRSAFLSAFFTLVSTHGIHVSFGLLWMGVMIVQLLCQGVNAITFRRLVIFSLFWHFLDLVWIFIFTFVYLMGVI